MPRRVEENSIPSPHNPHNPNSNSNFNPKSYLSLISLLISGKVEEKLKDGWVLYGNPMIHGNSTIVQVMIKYHKNSS